MIRDLLKWVAPGLATVLGGTALCLALTSTNIASDTAQDAVAAMHHAGYDWAELSFDMRDVVLSGTTTDRLLSDDAVARLSALPGVRSVRANVVLAPLASPYALVAAIDGGDLSLSGAVPDLATQAALLEAADLEEGQLSLRSGMPDRRVWSAGARYAVDQIDYFDHGHIAVSDLTISLEGRAASERAYRDLLIVLRAGPPEGLEFGSVSITPALVTPYTWQAISDGKRIDITGYAPDDTLAERLHAAEVGGLSVSTGLSLGSGEPTGFADLTSRLVEQLARLEYGTATISDDAVTLSGAPPTEQVAQAVVNELESSGSIIVLEPPRIDDYWVSATLQPGGTIVFDGYAPDAATRDALGARGSVDVSYLKLGRGAPERYQSAVDFGLTFLAKLSEGRFSLRDNVVTLVGQAATGADYLALLDALQQGAPQGLVLARGEIAAPRAQTFVWSISKSGDGQIEFDGMVPSPAMDARLRQAAGENASGAITYASGEPFNFEASATTALAMLPWLSEGSVELSGAAWLITGTPKSAIDKAAIEADFQARQLASAGWSMAIAEPIPTTPLADPYTWSVDRAADGSVTLSGHVPNAGLQRYLVVHAGDTVTDRTTIASGEPAGFVAAATAALDAVLALSTGSGSFDGATWSLSGVAESPAQRDALLASVRNAIPAEQWDVNITAPEPAPAPPAPYVWSATKSADGTVVMQGMLPAEALQRFVAVRAGDQVTDETVVSLEAPSGFADDVLAAIDALATLSTGSARFDGEAWSIEGQLSDAAAPAALDAALAAASTPAGSWQLTLISPPPAVEPPVAEAAAEEPEIAPQTEPVPVEQAPPLASVEPVEPMVDPDYAFMASRSGDQVMLSGQVPADAALRYFVAITGGDAAAVSIAAGAPEPFLSSAEIGLRALLQLSEAQMVFAHSAWRLTGTAPDQATRDTIIAALAADAPGNWTANLALPPPPAVPVAVAPEPEPVAIASPPVDVAACRAPLADFTARNAILFQSGAAIIAAESASALDELAASLASCPDAIVHIEGHTDADGDEQLNLALSVARAEAVVNALVERDVNPARLYAVGYGEAQPIADNDTAAGKRLNRRIVVTVSDQHF